MTFANPWEAWPAIIGFLGAPIIGGYVFGLVQAAVNFVNANKRSARLSKTEPFLLIPVNAALVLIVVAPMGYLGLVLVGIPSAFVLTWAGQESWWAYAACGAVGGLAMPAVKGRGGSSRAMKALAGALILAAFAVIAGRGG